ncbi:hypothetical protein GCM10027074_09400 [Streptomyces deserti]
MGTPVRDNEKAAAETRQGLVDLQALVDALLTALTSGNPAAVLPAITDWRRSSWPPSPASWATCRPCLACRSRCLAEHGQVRLR